MIIDMKELKKARELNKNKSDQVMEEANSIDYDAIAAMLCGKKLSSERKEEIEKFNRTYDAAEAMNKDEYK